MSMHEVATAMQRLQAVLRRRPDIGLQDDAPAVARWEEGVRVVASHANGTQIVTDGPPELGGSGAHVSPGWMLRASIATCAAACVATVAAMRDVELTALEIAATSRSDIRGFFGMREADGTQVPAHPQDLQLSIRVAARDIDADELRALVEQGIAMSPMACAACNAMPIALHVDVD